MALVGGYAYGGAVRADGEVFDPGSQTWQPLPPMAHGRANHGVVAVAGGVVAVGGRGATEANLTRPDEVASFSGNSPRPR